MKKVSIIIIAAIIIASFAGCNNKSISTENFNGEFQQENIYLKSENIFIKEMKSLGYNDFTIYDFDDVSREILENRNGKVIVERVIGVVTSYDGDGKVLNSDNYISYKRANILYGKGSIILTYLVYNPNTDYVDDVIERYDYCIDATNKI